MAAYRSDGERWCRLLSRLVAIPRRADVLPLVVYSAEPPQADADWPDGLPAPCAAIVDLYARCDGGHFADYLWAPLAGLSELNRRWREGQSGDGGPLDPERHLVLAQDSGGAPLVWDAREDRMATFWPDGGDWEPTGLTAEEFLASLFTPPADTNDHWAQALRLLEAEVQSPHESG